LVVKEGHKSVRIPVAAIHGARPGEHVVVIANQHGGEVNGVEAVRRFCEQADPRRMRGTVIVIPSANPRAAMLMNECWPEDEDESLIARSVGCPYVGPGGNRNNCAYNMNRKWPGRKGAKLVDRMCYEIWNQAVATPGRKAVLLVDIHCHQYPCEVYARDSLAVDLGVITGIPDVVRTGFDTNIRTSNTVAVEHGIMGLTIELGGQVVMREESIETGRRAILNLLRFYGMLPWRLELPERTHIHDPWRNDIEKDRRFARSSYAIYKSRHAGLVISRRPFFDRVRKGDVICEVLDPYRGRIVEECRAPMSGSIYSYRFRKPVCARGEDLFIIGVDRYVNTAEHVRRLEPCRFRLSC
jgi:predicted deacylase